MFFLAYCFQIKDKSSPVFFKNNITIKNTGIYYPTSAIKKAIEDLDDQEDVRILKETLLFRRIGLICVSSVFIIPLFLKLLLILKSLF